MSDPQPHPVPKMPRGIGVTSKKFFFAQRGAQRQNSCMTSLVSRKCTQVVLQKVIQKMCLQLSPPKKASAPSAPLVLQRTAPKRRTTSLSSETTYTLPPSQPCNDENLARQACIFHAPQTSDPPQETNERRHASGSDFRKDQQALCMAAKTIHIKNIPMTDWYHDTWQDTHPEPAQTCWNCWHQERAIATIDEERKSRGHAAWGDHTKQKTCDCFNAITRPSSASSSRDALSSLRCSSSFCPSVCCGVSVSVAVVLYG